MNTINFYIKKHLSLQKLEEVALIASIISLSLNVFLVWRPEWSYWQGHFIDYWAPKLSLSQLTLWFLWGIHLFRRLRAGTTRGKQPTEANFRHILTRPTYLFFIFGIGSLILRQFFSSHPWSAGVWLFALLTGPALLALYLWRVRPKKTVVIYALLIGIGLQAVLGLYQYVFQSNLAPYWLFGEPLFQYKNLLATSTFSSQVLVLPYGGTPHPNILAAWLTAGILLVLWSQWGKVLWRLPLFLLFLSVLFLTESYSAWLTLILGIFFMRFQRHFSWNRKWISPTWVLASLTVLITLIFTLGVLLWPTEISGKTRNFWDQTSFSRRQNLLAIGFREIPTHLWGTGWNQHLTTYSPLDKAELQPGFIQPIHNVWVIFVIESGIWTLFIATAFLAIVQKKYSYLIAVLFILSPIFSLDHYFYTHISGQFLFILYVYFLFLLNTDKYPYN